MVFDFSYGLHGSCSLMVLVLHFFFIVLCDCRQTEEVLVAKEDDRCYHVVAIWEKGKKVLINCSRVRLVHVQDYTYMFQKFTVH